MSKRKANLSAEAMCEVTERGFYDASINTAAGKDAAEWAEQNTDIEIERYRRACGYVRLFAHDKNADQELNGTVYDALLLQGLYENVHAGEDNDYESAQELKRYVDTRKAGEDETSVLKTLALCEDILHIREYYDNETRTVATQNAGSKDIKKSLPLYLRALKDLEKKVHVESFVLQSAIMLDRLKNPVTDTELVDSDIQEVETFYAPLMDSLGFNAMASEMQSSCDILRLNKQGKEDVTLRAVELRKRMDGIDVPAVVQDLFGLEEPPRIDWQIDASSNDYEAGVNCYFGEMKFYADGQEINLKFRKKSIGRIARKLDRLEEGEGIRDFFGIKCIVGDDGRKNQDLQRELLSRLYVQAGANMLSNDNIELSSTKPGIRSPFFVQGAEGSGFTDFVKRMSPVSFGVQVCSKDYEVAKIMAIHNGQPLEVQFQTGCFYYNDDKRGPRNHALHRTGLADKVPAEEVFEVYNGIRGKKDFFGDGGHNRTSLFAALTKWTMVSYRILQLGR